jgi:glycosyltransferase involved in cell wall biosynthesis/peptidoglycan/xylan/chitin deacetylase (PgdA/CDA1 family)
MSGAVLRVGLLMDHPSPHMVAFLDALARCSDCAVHVVYFRASAPERSWGAPPGALPYRIAVPTTNAPFAKVQAVLRAMAALRADIWVVNARYSAAETWFAIAWLNAMGHPWVYMNEPPRPRRLLWGALKDIAVRRLLRRAAGVIGMGEEATRRIAALAKPAIPATSVPYYIDLDPFLRLPRSEPAKPVRFLTVAQMIRRKGIDVLRDACARLPPAGWTLTFVGTGPQRDRLENAFRKSWGPEQVRFLGDIPYDERAKIFAEHHVFVFPSRWDGWGMAPVEAMAAGLPVIATDQTMSMRDFLRDGDNGYRVPSGDPDALAERMGLFIADPHRIPAMGEAGRAALAGYQADAGAERFVSFLSRFVRRRSGAIDGAPTWNALTETSGRARHIRRGVRALAKRAVIDAATTLQRQARPHGDRILVYHLVLGEDRARFDAHLAFLRDHFRLVTMSELLEGRAQNNGTPRVAITFDDGFRVQMADALDLLQKHGAKATFFVPTGFIELESEPGLAADYSLRAHHYGRPLAAMTVDDLRDLQRLGHEIGSHGVSHLSMSAVAEPLAHQEAGTSRARLTNWLGHAPAGFAYPYGHAVSSVGDPAAWVAAAGYRYAVTLRRGPVLGDASRMRLPREHVEGNWRVRDLRYFLSR